MQTTIRRKSKIKKIRHIELDSVIVIKKIDFASIYVVRYLDGIYAIDSTLIDDNKKTKIGVGLWKGILNFLKKNT